MQYEYGNEAASSRLRISIVGDMERTERTAGSEDVVTQGTVDGAVMGQLSNARTALAAGTLGPDLAVSSPNEGRHGAVVICEAQQPVIVRDEGVDPESGYWLTRRNSASERAVVVGACNAQTLVDMPE